MNHCVIYVVYACTYTLELAEPAITGNAFNIALVLCTQLISCSFVCGCRQCEIKGELVSPWIYVCVLEKRLGCRSNPCRHGGNLQRNHNELSMKDSSYKKESDIEKKEKKKKKRYEKRGKREKSTIFPW